MPEATNPTTVEKTTSTPLAAGVNAAVTPLLKLAGIRAGQRVLVIAWAEILQGAAAGSVLLNIQRTSGGAAVNTPIPSITLAIAEDKVVVAVLMETATSDDPTYILGLNDSTAATCQQAAIFGVPSN